MGKVWSTGRLFGWEDATSLLVHEAIFVSLDRQIAFWMGWMAGVPGLYPGF